MPTPPPPPILTATTTSTHQLLTLLKCIGFDPKAHIQLSSEGIRVTVEDTAVMQAHVFIYATLFTPYVFHAPAAASQDDPTVTLTLSLASLLTTLTLLPTTADAPPTTPLFTAPLHAPPALTLHYPAVSSPLTLTLTTGTLTTTAALTTHAPADPADIPLGALALRIILPAGVLHGAITGLDGGGEVLTVSARGGAVVFAVRGAQGEAAVEVGTGAMESWGWEEGREWRYGFRLVRRALPAMAVARKVSLRVDEEGVASWQFMVEVGEGEGGRGFVDFRMLPLVEE